MGGCCSSCCGVGEKNDDEQTTSAAEMELQEKQNAAAFTVARGMSAPTIDVIDRYTASGQGLALVTVAIEQDTAYWEVHVEEAAADETNESKIMFGVAMRKDRKFYKALEENEEADSPESNGTALLQHCQVKPGDIVGVLIQQNDFPMIQLSVNGTPSASINRFKGTVHPAVHLGESAKVRFEFVTLTHLPSSNARWKVMVARGLV